MSPFEKITQEQFVTKPYRHKALDSNKGVENLETGITNHDPIKLPCASYRTNSREPTERNERGKSLNNKTHTSNLFSGHNPITER